MQRAARMAGLHSVISTIIATIIATLVFLLWFPAPFHELIQGRQIFILFIIVDLVCGPILTFVLYDPLKPSYKWHIDIALISLIQGIALVYGVAQMAGARPVYIAFEGDRFRVVQANDVDRNQLLKAPQDLAKLSYKGPQLLGVRMLDGSDPEFTLSIQLAMQGLHPAFRPARWVPYDSQRPAVSQALRPLGDLKAKHARNEGLLNPTLTRLGLDERTVGYLPLVREETTDWVALVRKSDAQPIAYLHMDGW